MSDPDCPAGCCGLDSTAGCNFPSTDVTCVEYACSAGAPRTTDDPNTCFQGSTPTLEQLTSTWQSTDCATVYSEILNNRDGSQEYNPDNLARIQADTNHLLETYLSYGKDFTNSISNATPLQGQLIKMCSDTRLPGACDLFLQNYCRNKLPSEVANDPTLNSMCGCYVTDNACDPGCKLSTTVKRVPDPTTGKPNECNSTVCVINDVVINQVGGYNAKVPAFTQICPSCTPENPCACQISGVSVTGTLDAAGIGATYSQYCNTDTTVCYNIGPNGTQNQVTCPAESQFDTNEGQSNFLVILFVVIFFLVLVIGLMYFMTKRRRHSEMDELIESKGFDPSQGIGGHGGDNEWVAL